MIFKVIKKKQEENDKILCDIIKKVPNNERVCIEILDLIRNNGVKVVKESEYTSSFYNVFGNKIILADNEKQKTSSGRVTVIAHECIHSIQNKFLLYLNTIISNINFLIFIVYIVLTMFSIFNVGIVGITIYAILVTINILVRLYIELDAVKRSIGLTKKYLERYLTKDENNKVEEISRKSIKSTLPLFIINLTFGHIIRFILFILLYSVIF